MSGLLVLVSVAGGVRVSGLRGPGGRCVAAGAAGLAGDPDSIKLRMSFFVTRPLIPVPSSCLTSMPCSSAILRTSGLDFVRRNSSALAPSLLR